MPTRESCPSSPVAGVVLKRVRESETVVPAGDPLLEIGDPHQLEIVADLLSVDAVRAAQCSRARRAMGRQQDLDARVRRIEPSGFTKISALGVEEQRVNVIIDFTDPAEAWRALGDEFRVQTRTVLWESDDALKVPTGALVRVGDAWAVYAVRDGRARRVTITLGHQNGRDAEVASGIDAGAVVILHPGDTIADDVRVAPRTTP